MEHAKKTASPSEKKNNPYGLFYRELMGGTREILPREECFFLNCGPSARWAQEQDVYQRNLNPLYVRAK